MRSCLADGLIRQTLDCVAVLRDVHELWVDEGSVK